MLIGIIIQNLIHGMILYGGGLYLLQHQIVFYFIEPNSLLYHIRSRFLVPNKFQLYHTKKPIVYNTYASNLIILCSLLFSRTVSGTIFFVLSVTYFFIYWILPNNYCWKYYFSVFYCFFKNNTNIKKQYFIWYFSLKTWQINKYYIVNT